MHRIVAAALVAATSAVAVSSARAGVNLNINIDAPAPPVRVVAPAPPPVVIEEPPEFLMPSPLGFYVAVGVPYDLFYISNSYYLWRNNAWYCAPHYRGPWRVVQYKALPPGLRKHRFEKIHEYRDAEYRHYREDRHGYRGRWYKPEKEWKEHRKEERERFKEERRHDKAEFREERRHEKAEWKEDRRREKEEWKHGRGRDD